MNRYWKKNRAVAILMVCSLLLAPMGQVSAAETKKDEKNGNIVENEILIVYNDADTSEKEAFKIQSKAEAFLEEREINVTEELQESGEEQGTIVAAELPEDMSVAEAIEEVEKDDNVNYAQPNYIYQIVEDCNLEELSTGTNDPYADDPDTYFVKSTKAADVWDDVRAQHDVTVAVFDTGCRLNHEDLKNNILTDKAYDAYYDRKMTTSNIPYGGDADGHGTHICGLIAAQADNQLGTSGVSYNANILPVKIYGNNKSRESATTKQVIGGINYCKRLIDNGEVKNLRVINMSIGYYMKKGMTDFTNGERALSEAITDLREHYNVLTVCAGGNGDGQTEAYTDSMYPGDLEDCLAVTSLDRDGNNSVWSDYNSAKDISAPGEHLKSTSNRGISRYESRSGTSMAAPIVSGICALLWAGKPDATVDEVVEAIEKTADPVLSNSEDGREGVTGSKGAVNARKALDYLKKNAKNVKELSKASVKGISKTYEWKGKAVSPKPQVTYGGKTLKENTNYMLSYCNNTKPGTGTIVIRGIGKYAGERKKTFQIKPEPVKIARIKRKDRGFYIEWKKPGAKITGYQVQYSRKKTFKNSTIVKVAKNRTDKRVRNLKKGEIYYVRIRTCYRTDGKTCYSAWSKAKWVRIK